MHNTVDILTVLCVHIGSYRHDSMVLHPMYLAQKVNFAAPAAGDCDKYTTDQTCVCKWVRTKQNNRESIMTSLPLQALHHSTVWLLFNG